MICLSDYFCFVMEIQHFTNVPVDVYRVLLIDHFVLHLRSAFVPLYDFYVHGTFYSIYLGTIHILRGIPIDLNLMYEIWITFRSCFQSSNRFHLLFLAGTIYPVLGNTSKVTTYLLFHIYNPLLRRIRQHRAPIPWHQFDVHLLLPFLIGKLSPGCL